MTRENTHCVDCGCELDPGTAKVFTCCDECWDKAYHPRQSPASVPPEPPTLSDEPRAGRRRNTALPPIGDVSPDLCYECGGAHPLVVREKRMARWGQDPEVEIEDEWYRCPKCGDGYYTFEQAQAHERALWLATIAALRAELADARADLQAIRDECRVICYPPIVTAATPYPIEHSAVARKNMWNMILAELRALREYYDRAARSASGNAARAASGEDARP